VAADVSKEKRTMVTKSVILREYVFSVDGVEHPVYGRIVQTNEIENCPFRWDISHYYRPSESAITVYHPSRHHAESFEEAEGLLLDYANAFTDIDVTPSKDY